MKPNVWYKTKVRNEKNTVLESIQIEKKEVAHTGEGHGKKAHH
jgi:hypothetical protein